MNKGTIIISKELYATQWDVIWPLFEYFKPIEINEREYDFYLYGESDLFEPGEWNYIVECTAVNNGYDYKFVKQ